MLYGVLVAQGLLTRMRIMMAAKRLCPRLLVLLFAAVLLNACMFDDDDNNNSTAAPLTTGLQTLQSGGD